MSIARSNHTNNMQSNPKRTTQVNVKMSAEDFATLQKAARVLWPGAVLTNSGIVLGLAKIGATEALKRKSGKKS